MDPSHVPACLAFPFLIATRFTIGKRLTVFLQRFPAAIGRRFTLQCLAALTSLKCLHVIAVALGRGVLCLEAEFISIWSPRKAGNLELEFTRSRSDHPEIQNAVITWSRILFEHWCAVRTVGHQLHVGASLREPHCNVVVRAQCDPITMVFVGFQFLFDDSAFGEHSRCLRRLRCCCEALDEEADQSQETMAIFPEP